jgi:hypothetical protein
MVFDSLRSGAGEFARRAALRVRAACASWWGTLRRHAAVVAGLISGALLVLDALWFTDHLPRAKTYGDIWVESPEVYTRERLVNDRFRQEAWLLAQLPAASRIELPGLPASLEMRQQDRSGQLKVAVGQTAKAEGGGAPLDARPNATQTSESRGARSETPARGAGRALSWQESLSEYVDFTEYVRNLLVENQLDDRHDLLGNSLYKLKFDVTLVPGANTQASAVVTVKLGPRMARPSRSRGPGGTGDDGPGRVPPGWLGG